MAPLRAAVLVLSVLGAFCQLPNGWAEDYRRPKKLIATGWDQVDVQRLAEQLSEMERRPFDGVVIRVIGETPEGRSVPLNWAFHAAAWDRSWFEESVEKLRSVKSQKLTDNFILVNANPGDVDWFDDAGWAQIVAHCRIAAWVARQGGARGILFDPEPYAPPHALFHYAAQPGREEHTFAEYYAEARQRGRQMMEAIVEQYPEITLFCYFMNSINVSATGRADPRPALAGMHYGLYSALIDGWLDAAPPEVTFVDGCESAYRYNSTREYLEAATAMRGACQELVAPENRAKYRAQVQVGFGIYLDAYWNPKDSPWSAWYIDGLGGPRVERLRANTATALRLADEYVWIYGEKFRWWPTPNPSVRAESWPEVLPGCDRILAFVRDPVGYARGVLSGAGGAAPPQSLARNGDFAAEQVTLAEGAVVRWSEGRAPAGWSAWQNDSSHGQFLWDRETGAQEKGSALARGVADGCFIQSHAAEPGQRYAVCAQVRTAGRGEAYLRVRWKSAEEKWTAEAQDRVFLPEDSAEPWRELFGVVEVPEGAARLVVLLGVRGQQSAEDAAWFDDVGLFRLP